MGLDPSAAGPLGRYCELLLGVAAPAGFLGPHEAPRLVPRHILESAALTLHLPDDGTLIDVGSGAGLPGVVLACLRQGPVVLLEAEGRRSAFLERVAEELELGVTVLKARAEEAARAPELRDRCSAAVTRALAAPPVALELTLPFVAPGGVAVLAVGPSAVGSPGDVDTARRAAETLGGDPPDLRSLRVPGLREQRWAIIVRKVGRGPDRYPRRTGVPAKRPLGGSG